MLRSALSSACREELITRNVAKLVEPPRTDNRELKPWTLDETLDFLAASRKYPLYAAFVLAIAMGLRRGEIIGLRRSDLDLDNRVLYVRQQTQRRRGVLYDDDPKSRRRRAVPLPALCIAPLRWHRMRQADARAKAGEGWNESDHVFTTRTGRPVEPRNVRFPVSPRPFWREGHDALRRHQGPYRNSVITFAKNQMENTRHASHSPHKAQRASRRIRMSGSSPVASWAVTDSACLPPSGDVDVSGGCQPGRPQTWRGIRGMAWLGPVLALAGVLVGAVFAPLATTRFGWQTSRREAIDRAIACVRRAELATTYPRQVHRSEIGVSDEALRYQLDLPLRGFERYYEATQEMRAALAVVEPFLGLDWDGSRWQTPDEEYARLLDQLKRARRRTLLAYWGNDRRITP